MATKEVTIFSDGSCINGGVGAAASLWIKGRIKKTITYHLGPESDHTVFEAELIGVILALHLLRCRKAKTHVAYIGLDNQAVIQALGDQKPKPGHYLLDKIHDLAEDFQIVEARKRGEGLAGLRLGGGVKLNSNGSFSWRKDRIQRTSKLTVAWVPGHVRIEGNEAVDAEAKKAAEGHSSELKKLPPFLRRKSLPVSVSANKQAYLASLKNTWTNEWRQSVRGLKLLRIDISTPSRKFLTLSASLKRNQTSLLTQLRSGHAPLNAHLFRIKRAPSPHCPHCQDNSHETVFHYIMKCPHYHGDRMRLFRALRRSAHSFRFLLSDPSALIPLFDFIQNTARFTETFGEVKIKPAQITQPQPR
jgi:ribonuclease HI